MEGGWASQTSQSAISRWRGRTSPPHSGSRCRRAVAAAGRWRCTYGSHTVVELRSGEREERGVRDLQPPSLDVRSRGCASPRLRPGGGIAAGTKTSRTIYNKKMQETRSKAVQEERDRGKPGRRIRGVEASQWPSYAQLWLVKRRTPNRGLQAPQPPRMRLRLGRKCASIAFRRW